MKVLVISNLYPPLHIGGYEISCKDTVDLLTGEGIDCRVLTSDFNGYSLDTSVAGADANNPLVERRLKLHTNWGTSYSSHGLAEASAYNWEIIEMVIRDFNPDIVYIWNTYGLGALRFYSLNPELRQRCVHHFMDLSLFPGYAFGKKRFPKSLLSRLKRRFFVRNTNPGYNTLLGVGNHIYASMFIRESVQREYPVSNSAVLYPPVCVPHSTKTKTSFALDLENIRCVYLGQIAPHKGVEDALEAVKSVVADGINIHVVIYGNCTDPSYLEALKSKYKGFFTIETGVPRYRILADLPSYDMGFFPSRWQEPFGMAQAELAYAGLPILSTATGGAGELGLHATTMLRFKPGCPQSLQAKLKYLIRNYGQVAPTLSTCARYEVMRMCDREVYIIRLRSFFTHILQARPEEMGVC